jgi:quinol---cytochrome c reductase cytochrome c subunit, bacillus type
VTIKNPSASLRARRAEFARYKEDVQKRGKPFYPFAMFHDTVMSLVVVIVIVALACIWKWTIPGDHTGTGAGWLGPLYTDRADPGTTSFVPRPDWYFYFLFYLLRIFKWPDSVILGTVGIPTIIMVLMLLLPFLDRRHERRLSRRPVAVVITILTVIAMGTLTYKGATAKEALASEVVGAVPNWVKKNNLPPSAVPGAKLFAQSGCLTCHTYLGTGSSNLGAPDLSAEGARGRGIQFQINHLKCPSCVHPGSPMPPFASLGEENLRKIAIFLEASKGPK